MSCFSKDSIMHCLRVNRNVKQIVNRYFDKETKAIAEIALELRVVSPGVLRIFVFKLRNLLGVLANVRLSRILRDFGSLIMVDQDYSRKHGGVLDGVPLNVYLDAVRVLENMPLEMFEYVLRHFPLRRNFALVILTMVLIREVSPGNAVFVQIVRLIQMKLNHSRLEFCYRYSMHSTEHYLITVSASKALEAAGLRGLRYHLDLLLDVGTPSAHDEFKTIVTDEYVSDNHSDETLLCMVGALDDEKMALTAAGQLKFRHFHNRRKEFVANALKYKQRHKYLSLILKAFDLLYSRGEADAHLTAVCQELPPGNAFNTLVKEHYGLQSIA